KSEGRQAWERYEFLKDNGASADELCDAASEAAEAYSREQKQTDRLPGSAEPRRARMSQGVGSVGTTRNRHRNRSASHSDCVGPADSIAHSRNIADIVASWVDRSTLSTRAMLSSSSARARTVASCTSPARISAGSSLASISSARQGVSGSCTGAA